jgi:hypothetical protein
MKNTNVEFQLRDLGTDHHLPQRRATRFELLSKRLATRKAMTLTCLCSINKPSYLHIFEFVGRSAYQSELRLRVNVKAY